MEGLPAGDPEAQLKKQHHHHQLMGGQNAGESQHSGPKSPNELEGVGRVPAHYITFVAD